MKNAGSLLLFLGIGTIVLNLAGYEFAILSWIDNWGETAGWVIRGAMIAVGAICDIASASGGRQLPVEDFVTGVGRNALEPGEFLLGLKIPTPASNTRDAYLRFIPRTEMDIAVVGCAVNLRVDGDTITEARVVLGAVAPTIRAVQACADALIGTTLDDAALEALDKAARAACEPIDDKRGTVEFRTDVAGVLARRAAKIAYARAKGEQS